MALDKIRKEKKYYFINNRNKTETIFSSMNNNSKLTNYSQSNLIENFFILEFQNNERWCHC